MSFRKCLMLFLFISLFYIEELMASPANDDFSLALPLVSQSGLIYGSNIGATTELNEPFHAGESAEYMTCSVWYSWIAGLSGPVAFRASSQSSFYPHVVVYTSKGFSLTRVYPESGSWPNNQAVFSAETGRTYYVAICGYNGQSGDFSLQWKQYPPAVNDHFANATDLSGISGHVIAANVFCSREEGEPVHADAGRYYYGDRASVWWTWTAPSNGLVFFNAAASEFDAAVAVYTGSLITGLTKVVSSENSVSFKAQQGTTYRIVVEGSGWEWGGIDLKWSMPSQGSGQAALAGFFLGGDPADLQAANKQFQTAVAANMQDCQSLIYAALTGIGNLINDDELKSLMTRFGFNYLDSGTNGWEFSGTFNPAGPLPSNQEVDKIWSRCQPSIDAAYALLSSIPSNWTGTAEISWDCFPVDTTVYVDYADVLAARASLKAVRSFMNTIRAYDMTVDYQKLDWPVTAAVKAVSVDGNSADWASVPVQLYGEQGSVLNTARVCQSGNRIYVLIDRDSPVGSSETTECFCGGVMIRMDDGSKDELQFQGILSAGCGNQLSFKAGTMESWDVSNGVIRVSGNFIELSCDVPASLGTVQAAGYLTSIGYGTLEIWWGDPCWLLNHSNWWGRYCVEEMSFIKNYPALKLFALAPDILSSVRNVTALTEAKSDLTQSLTFAQDAALRIKNRTDSQLHFLEYDPADAIVFDQLMDDLAMIKASLSASQRIVIDGGLNDLDLYLGAFFSSPYMTRSMLPAFGKEALLSDPTPGTFPDPTFGGIFPQATQGALSAGLAGYPLNVPAPAVVMSAQRVYSSKVVLSWIAVEGVAGYEVWRSASPDRGTAQKIATIGAEGYIDRQVDPENTYYYWVRGYNRYQTGAFTPSPVIGVTLARPSMPWLNLLLE